MMQWFDTLFPMAMILFPGVFTWFVRAGPQASDAARAARIRALHLRLWGGTAAALALFALLRLSGGLAGEAASYLWLAFFPLWFRAAMPLLQEKDPGWRPLRIETTRRAASLVRRDRVSPALQGARWVSWMLWAALVTALVLVLAQSAASQWWLLAFPAFGALQLAGGVYFSRLSALEPEPLAAAGAAELQRTYARLGVLKAWGWYSVTTAAMIAFGAAPLAAAWNDGELLEAAIWIGAGGGALVGIAGAALGITADLQRAKARRLYGEVAHRSEAGRGAGIHPS
jgi:hypothetical protein